MDLSSAVYQVSKAKVRHTWGFACAKPHAIRLGNGAAFPGSGQYLRSRISDRTEFPGQLQHQRSGQRWLWPKAMSTVAGSSGD